MTLKKLTQVGGSVTRNITADYTKKISDVDKKLTAHNHDTQYLGKTATAVNSSKLENVTKAQIVTESRANLVPTARKINGLALTTDITLNHGHVGALAAGATAVNSNKLEGVTKAQIVTEARANLVHSSRKVNGLALTSDITLNHTHVGAAPASHSHAYIPTAEKAKANGVATLGSDGKIPQNQIPAIAITETFTAKNEAEMLKLVAQTGDVCRRSDLKKSFILSGTPASTIGNWLELYNPDSPVTSVNGMVGTVKLNYGHVGALAAGATAVNASKLENSTKAQIIAEAKQGLAPSSHNHSPSQVGLGNVPNSIHTSNPTANTVPLRDGSGDLQARLVRTNYADEATPSGGLVFRINNSSNNFHRVCNNVTNIRNWLGAAPASHNHAYVPDSRTVNGLRLNANISLTHSHVGAAPASHTHAYVPDSRTVNGLRLNANITLNHSHVGAAPASHSHNSDQIGLPLTTLTKTLTLTTTWQDTGIFGSHLESGSYMLQISGMNSSGGFYSEIFTGVMSWYSADTNSADADEIILHHAGRAASGKQLYLRVLRQSGTKPLKLQMCASAGLPASPYTFKFRRII